MDSEKLFQRSEKLIPQSTSLVFTDYRDDFDHQGSVISECIKKKSDTPLIEMYEEWFGDMHRDSVNRAIEELREDLQKEFNWHEVNLFIASKREALESIIEERDDSDPIGECLSRTRMRTRIELMSNYESFTPLYVSRTFCYVNYVVYLLKALQLNPKHVKEALEKRGIKCSGQFSDYKCRDGKEIVDYDDFAEMIDETCGYGRLTFVGAAPLKEMYEKNFGMTKITIPKGTKVIMYNSWDGSGSMEIETKKPLVIDLSKTGKTKYDRFELILDVPAKQGGHGYDTGSVYGWGYSFNNLFTIE